MVFGHAHLRLALLGKLGWRGWIRFSQQRALLKDVFRGLFLLSFRGKKLRESRLVQMMLPSREMVSTRSDVAPGSAETVDVQSSSKPGASVDSDSSQSGVRSSSPRSDIS
jgi:hypothetical protein